MPRQRAYTEKYRNPYEQPHRARGVARDITGTPLNSRARRNLYSRGHFRMSHLPALGVMPGPDDMERRAISKTQYPQYTLLERIFMKELLNRRLVWGADFDVQVSLNGGKTVRGGFAPDIVIYHPRNCAVEVQGGTWHSGIVDDIKDEVKEMWEKANGIPEVLYVDEYTLASPDLTRQWFRQNLGI